LANNRLAEESIDISRWFFIVTTIVGGALFVLGLIKIRRNTHIKVNATMEEKIY
jgi:F0F1-type ATP synthase assembly protein I